MLQAAIIALSVAILAVTLDVNTAYANSAPAYWSGGGASFGTLFYGDGKCPLTVEHERLIFDVEHYPSNYYDSAAEFNEYDGRVTAEYSFFNPESYDITATLMFPFGTLPDYADISDGNGSLVEISDTLKYSVTLNGADIPKTLRHTYYPHMHYRNESFDTASELSKLSSGYLEHTFYSPDTPVTVYSYTAVGVPSRDDKIYPYAATALDPNPSETQVIIERYNGFDNNDGTYKYGFFVDYNDSNKIYAIGKPFDVAPSWTVYSDGGMKSTISGSIALTSVETITFEKLALSRYNENGEVSKTDWYNAVVAALDDNEWMGVNTSSVLEVGDRLMRWYEYELTVPAGDRAVNSVTAPIYPSIDGSRKLKSPVYGYTYLLSPARHWAQFGEIDITVNTPDYIVSCSIDGFTKTENGYTVTLSGLPDDELTFYLCANDIEYPPKSSIWSNIVFILMIVLISTTLLVTVIIVVIRKNAVKKRRP